jgi:hypothetical protein
VGLVAVAAAVLAAAVFTEIISPLMNFKGVANGYASFICGKDGQLFAQSTKLKVKSRDLIVKTSSRINYYELWNYQNNPRQRRHRAHRLIV